VGSDVTRSTQLAVGRPRTVRVSGKGGPSESVKTSIFDEALLDSRHALVFMHEPFNAIRIAFSHRLWGQPTGGFREKPHTLGDVTSCVFTPSNPTHCRRLQDRGSLFRGTRRRVGGCAPGDQDGVDANVGRPLVEALDAAVANFGRKR